MNFARAFLRWCFAFLIYSTGLAWWARRSLIRQRAVVVLTFHRVLSGSDFERTLSLPGMKIRTETFTKLIEYLDSFCFMADPLSAGSATPHHRLAVVLAFDDGWLDNVSALRTIPRHIHPVIFICPGLMDQQAPFWPEQVAQRFYKAQETEALVESIKQMPESVQAQHLRKLASLPSIQEPAAVDRTMSWEHVLELKERGVRFGSHTQNHKIATGLSEERLDWELRQSIAEINERLQGSCDLFAYPNGSYSETAIGIVRRHVTAAFTTEPGAWLPTTDPHAIPRMNMCEEKFCGPFGSFSRVLVHYNLFWKCWRASNSYRRVPGTLPAAVTIGAEQ